jgi:hypothetical protein
MSSRTDYQISYGTIRVDAPASAGTAPLYASEDGMVASLSNSECIFQARRTGDTHVMTYQVLQALDQCREFRPLEEHIARIQTTVAGLQTQREGVRRVLESLIARGLLVSDRGFLERIAEAPRGAEPAPLRAVFIRACDRPAEVERLLKSLTEYERTFRRARRYVLVDDSSTTEASNRNRDLLREFARATGCKLAYFGATEQARLAERLTKAVPRSAAALSQLVSRSASEEGRFGGGRAWNLALLLSAGARFVLLDDDQCLPLRAPDGQRAGIDPDPSAAARTQFFRTIEDAFAAGERVEDDPFERHLEILGRRFGSIIGDPRYAIERQALAGLSLSQLDHLRGEAGILATLHGAYGSSRTESGAWLYQLGIEDRAEFWRDRESYLRNVEGASIWYGCRQARVMTSGNFSPFAFDNTELLPCTNPYGRGEDALFARVTRFCRPDSLALELPLAIGHAQEAPRRRSDRTLRAPPPRFNYFISDFVQRQLGEALAEDPAQRLGLLASNLRDVAGASEARRLRLLREYLAYVRADAIERLQHQYEAAGDAPVYWQADIRSIIEANGRAVTSKQPPRLGDWPDDIDDAACASRLRDDCERLAAGYEAWPALWAHAREQGERLLAAI